MYINKKKLPLDHNLPKKSMHRIIFHRSDPLSTSNVLMINPCQAVTDQNLKVFLIFLTHSHLKSCLIRLVSHLLEVRVVCQISFIL